jgi:hypothetical protein
VSAALPYADDVEYLHDELRRLDLLVLRRLTALPRDGEPDPQTQLARTVYVTREEVERLLAAPARPGRAGDGEAAAALDHLAAEIAQRVDASKRDGVRLGLPTLAVLFGLSPFERLALLVCLAPELRRTYDRVYAYLQDDLTRRLPSIDLALDLLCADEGERWRMRSAFAESSTLRRAGLVDVVDDAQSPSGSSGLARFLRLDPRIRGMLVGDGAVDPRLVGVAGPHPAVADDDEGSGVDPAAAEQLERLLRQRVSTPDDGRPLVVELSGPGGAGGVELAAGLCGRLGVPVLELDARALLHAPGRDAHPPTLVRAAVRESLLQQAALVVRDADLLADPAAEATLSALATGVADFGWLVVLAGAAPWPQPERFATAVVVPLRVQPPTGDRAVAAWRARLARHGHTAAALAPVLADRYDLTRERIRRAVDTAAALAGMRAEPEPTLDDVVAACRAQARGAVGDLAVKVEPERGWADLVLPDDRVAQLRELCDQIRFSRLVLDGWGFGGTRGRARRAGVTALFSGPPGTGKTLAAEVIAGAVGLDLFAVDLSSVVSKYIGETEKNLARVFDEAAACNAMLFFDEADALFGRRTEVTDAHDRYANIETGYLLQRIEQHPGVVLLATNLRQNLDDAFTRRLRFLVDFPFPDEADRQRIWRAHVPARAPIGDDVDFAYLARVFSLAGGNIRNVMLAAAFLAAADGGVIGQPHLLHGTRREFDKVGKIWTGGAV